MRIEINKERSREYFEELMYVASKRRNFMRNPDSRVSRFTISVTGYVLLALFGVLFAIGSYLLFRDPFFVIMLVLTLFCLLYGSWVLFTGKETIRELMQDQSSKALEFNEEGVRFISHESEVFLKWDAISAVVAGRYAICFLPSDIKNVIIGLSRDYFEEVREGLMEYEMEQLIHDTTVR